MQGLKLRLELLVFLFDFLAAAAFLVQFLVQLLEDVFVVALGARGLLRAAPDRLGRQALQIGTPVAIGTDEGPLPHARHVPDSRGHARGLARDGP